MRIITGDTVSQTIGRAFEVVQNEGLKQPTRNGFATAIFDTTFEFANPRARHLHLVGRKSNIFQLIAETFWVMSGANAVDPYLSFFLPRAVNYSDDGQTWHGAYGPRMYAFGQLKSAIERFKTDGLNTRRSFVQISMPHMDNDEIIEELYGEGHTPKDIPCNREIHFYVEDGMFHTKVIQRSGDLLFGTGSINPFEFSFLHELMFNEVLKMYPGQVQLGSYRWHVTNAHVYSDFEDQFLEVINNEQTYRANTVPLIGPAAGVDAWEHFFSSLVVTFASMISYDVGQLEVEKGAFLEDIDELIRSYWIPNDSLLVEYIYLTYHYILGKRGIHSVHNITKSLEGDLLDAVTNSPFRKFVLSE